MQVLASEDILRVWEIGLTQHALDRALTMLAAVFPDQTRRDLAQLSIGQRDGYLLDMHERTFGPRLAGQTQCPACQKQVEFTLNTVDIRLAPTTANTGQLLEVTCAGYTLACRLPNSLDLAAIVHQPSEAAARRCLIERCLLHVAHSGPESIMQEISTNALPDDVIALLAGQMAAHDPQADIELAMACPMCGHAWQLLFDIVTFLWVKIDTQARRLLREVNLLAQAYGWREADILALSAARRQLYLEMVS